MIPKLMNVAPASRLKHDLNSHSTFWHFAQVLVGIFFVLVLVRYGTVFIEQKVGIDDLFTIVLNDAPDLETLWRGIILGIDGNPPEYLSLVFVLTHFGTDAQGVIILHIVNLALVSIALFALYRISRRFCSPEICLLAIVTTITFNDQLRIAAFGMRTYALYFSLDAISLWLLVRYVERETALNWVFLTLGLTALAMSHTLAIGYVMSIVVGYALAALARGQRRVAVVSLGCVVPAVVLLALWTPNLITQSEVGHPYGWIPPPPILSFGTHVLCRS